MPFSFLERGLALPSLGSWHSALSGSGWPYFDAPFFLDNFQCFFNFCFYLLKGFLFFYFSFFQFFQCFIFLPLFFLSWWELALSSWAQGWLFSLPRVHARDAFTRQMCLFFGAQCVDPAMNMVSASVRSPQTGASAAYE